MKAFVCHSSTTSPRPQLKRQQSYTIPVPHQGQVLIRVLACGLCHTDLHVMQGDLKSPLSEWIPGHEVVGIVEALGDLKDESITEEMKGLKMREVEEKVKEEKVKVEEEIKVGDRVGVAWLHWCCGWCDLCLSGKENFCTRQLNTGFHVNGGLAQFIVAYTAFVVRIPDELSSFVAAPLLCAGVTTYRGLKECGLTAGQSVVVFGVGGLGHLGIQFAKAMGYNVIAIDVDEKKLELAKEMGADHTRHALHTQHLAQDIKQLSWDKQGPHAALITAVSSDSIRSGLDCIRHCGRVILLGLPNGSFSMDVHQTVFKGLHVVGSLVGTRQDLRECLQLSVQFKIEPKVERIALSQIPHGLERLKEGDVLGRLVVSVSSEEAELGNPSVPLR